MKRRLNLSVWLLLFVAIFLIGFLLSGCKKTPTKPAEIIKKTAPKGVEKVLKGKKAVMILAQNNFRDEEYIITRKVLEDAEIDVTLASTTRSEVKGMFKATAKPKLLIGEIKVEDYDAIIFIGGSGASEYFDNPFAHDIAREAVDKGKILAAICIAPHTLANAGVLNGKKATVFSSEVEAIKAKGAVYTGADVERDGNIITANGPGASQKFAETIVEALGE